MAKYVGTLTSDMRGKVGGLVFSKGQSGTTLKANRAPINPASSYQQATRAAVASAASLWVAMSAYDRTSWGVLAAQYTYTNSLAQTYSPTGQQLFTGAVVLAAKCSSVPPSTAPATKPVITAITTLSIVNSSPDLLVTAYSGGSSYDGYATFQASAPVNNSVNYIRSTRLRFMGFIVTGNELFMQTAYIAAYGSLPPQTSSIVIRAVPYDGASYIAGTPLVVSLLAVA